MTDPSFFNPYSSSLDSLDANFILYRDKDNPNYKKDAIAFIKLPSKAKKMIHQDIELAKELGAYGVHLTSAQFDKIRRAKELGLFVVVSTHSLEEIKRASVLGADAVTFSPIFPTPNKGKPKGVEGLKEAVKGCEIKIIALGGIVTKAHIEKIKKSGAWGFASIRYFEKSYNTLN
ncbi:MAG: thiamine phosphate synthase [Epsilonproteobacteria bacterium]|nr:thiamine phosphate synthase [Campylobacterota bacterium]